MSVKIIGNYIKRVQIVVPCLIERIKNSGAAYWVLTPTHGNLGDHAIAQAEKKLFDEWNIEVIEITDNELRRRMYSGLLKYMNGRTILLHGGGYLGTLWYREEELLRSVISSNPDSSIFILPNTVYYEESDWGKNEFDKSVKIYNDHHNLTVYTREKTSYSKVNELYKTVKLVPDMVFSMNYSERQDERNGCVICLRTDKEKTRSVDIENQIEQFARETFGSCVSYRDMVVEYGIMPEKRDSELEKQYSAFRKAELVITDRLHGMIFSAITGTPCIVFNSKSPKVKGCYEWIKELPYIKFCDNVNDLRRIWNELPKGSQKYDNSNLKPYYDLLKNDISEAMK